MPRSRRTVSKEQMPYSIFYKPISKSTYLSFYAVDEEKMAFYEGCLKKVNPILSLTTGLKELSKIFSIIERWDEILSERLSNAPSKVLATDLFKKELLLSIEYEENSDTYDPEKNSNYWNQFRKIAYEHYRKGQNVTLQGLGYLILRNAFTTEEGIDIILHISNVFDVEGVLISLAEGAALADYLYNEKLQHQQEAIPQTFDELFNEKYRKPEIIKLYVDVLRKVDPPLINDYGAYIGRYKTAFVIWINMLLGKEISKQKDEVFSRLLNSRFKGLNMGKDGGMFRKYSNSTIKYKEYEKDLNTLLSMVRVSIKKQIPLPKLPGLP